MKATKLLRSPMLLLQVVLVSLLLGGPVASCVADPGSLAWWAIAIAPVVVLLVVLDARRMEPVRVRAVVSTHRRLVARPLGRQLHKVT